MRFLPSAIPPLVCSFPVDRIGLGIPREAKLAVTGKPGSLLIRLTDLATLNRRPGLGGCTGYSGAPAFETDASGALRIIGVGELVDSTERRGWLRRSHRLDPAPHLPRLDRRHGEGAEIVIGHNGFRGRARE